jgi:hypothetical protein
MDTRNHCPFRSPDAHAHCKVMLLLSTQSLWGSIRVGCGSLGASVGVVVEGIGVGASVSVGVSVNVLAGVGVEVSGIGVVVSVSVGVKVGVGEGVSASFGSS